MLGFNAECILKSPSRPMHQDQAECTLMAKSLITPNNKGLISGPDNTVPDEDIRG